MESRVQQELASLERRCRTLTGIILAVVAFAAAYSLMLLEGQTARPSFHFYPWILAVLFYIAGDILAFLWFKIIAAHIAATVRAKEAELSQLAMAPPEETGASTEDQVEVIRPEKAGG